MSSESPGGEADAPEVNPFQAPAVEVAPKVSTSPLVQKLRRRSGNDLVYIAIFCTVFAFFIPFGFVLDAVSLFFLLRVVIGGHRPSVPCIVVGILTGLWNLFRLGVMLLVLVLSMAQV